VLCWLALGPIILGRLLTRPALPPRLLPTLAMELAPPALAGNAYVSLMGGRADLVVCLFLGYGLLMLLVQLCLLPVYRKLSFALSFWSFTFPFAALTAYVLRWTHLRHLDGSLWLRGLGLTAVTLLISWIAWRSLRFLRADQLLPRPVSS
jgi:tellurite resistance protein